MLARADETNEGGYQSKAFGIVYLLISIAAQLVGICIADEAPTKHLVTLADLQTLNTVDNIQLSPDGQRLAYVVSENGNDGIWLSTTRIGGVPRKIGTGKSPLWSPDGTKVLYVSKESAKPQLWFTEISSGRAVQVTNL